MTSKENGGIGELLTYASDVITSMHLVTFGLLIGGSFAQDVSPITFWVCWFLVLTDVGLASIFYLFDNPTDARAKRKVTDRLSLSQLVEGMRLMFIGPLAGILVWQLAGNLYWQSKQADSGRGKEVLVAIAVLACAQALSMFQAWLVVPAAVVVVLIMMLLLVVGVPLGIAMFVLMPLVKGIYGLVSRLLPGQPPQAGDGAAPPV